MATRRITGRRDLGGHLAIVRSHRARGLFTKLVKNKDHEGTGWYTSDAMDFFKYPKVFEEQLIRTCWACGLDYDRGTMTRCHIVACRHGGDDVASNYWLLCDYCHEEQPDDVSREHQEQWLLTREYFWDRIHSATVRLWSRIMEASGGKVKDIQNLTKAIDLATKWGEFAREAKTGSLIKGSATADDRMVEFVKQIYNGRG